MKLRIALIMTALLTLTLGPMARASAPSTETQWRTLVAQVKAHPADRALQLRVARFLKEHHATQETGPSRRGVAVATARRSGTNIDAAGLCYWGLTAHRSGLFGVYLGSLTFVWSCDEVTLDACAITGVNITAAPLTHVGAGIAAGPACGGNSTYFGWIGGWPRFIGVISALGSGGSLLYTGTYDF